MLRALAIVVAAALLVGGLSACGVRGPLEPPPGAVDANPAPGATKPHDPFVLDPLL